ncbi:MAG TPA: TetR/AcrR family transcriptional regulator [Bacteroidia bacterium]|jgi:AcrR family transcriptional regulator|nr:TetR/AcrR family transcriptional regulator [Bacteroidia bacterium]
MAVAKKKKTDGTTEEKIIGAARKLFTQKGYDATKTRDIAKEAGINLALLNYYFRSKEKLFEIIMKENMGQFMEVISGIINNEETSIEQKIESLVNNYIDMLMRLPDMPLFVMNHIKEDPERMEMRQKFMGSHFMKQVQKGIKSGEIAPMHPMNMMLNIVGLTIFPFVARHMFQNSGGITIEQFGSLMQERKRLIPKWIAAMLKVK